MEGEAGRSEPSAGTVKAPKRESISLTWEDAKVKEKEDGTEMKTLLKRLAELEMKVAEGDLERSMMGRWEEEKKRTAVYNSFFCQNRSKDEF